MTALTLSLAVSAAFLAAWLATFPVRRYAHVVGLLDRPNQRSSHVRTTPRGGGLAIIAGVLVGLMVLAVSGMPVMSRLLVAFGCACLVAAAGLFDDVRSLSPGARLIVQIAAALIAVWSFGPVASLPAPFERVAIPAAVGVALSGLWITAVINFFNFMDGFDGLATSQAIASCLGVVLAAWSRDATMLATITGAACLAFLSHNWAPARVFMGDVGSGFLGFILAVLPLLAPEPQRSTAIVAAAIGLTLFLLDPALTLVRRALAGKPLTESHREHLYQQLAAPGEHVGSVVTLYFSLAIILAAAGAFGYRRPEWLPWFVMTSLVVFSSVCAVALRAERRRRRLP